LVRDYYVLWGEEVVPDDPVNEKRNLPTSPDDPRQFIRYQAEDRQTRVAVHIFQETVWLLRKAMGELFPEDARTISEHIRNVRIENGTRMNCRIRSL